MEYYEREEVEMEPLSSNELASAERAHLRFLERQSSFPRRSPANALRVTDPTPRSHLAKRSARMSAPTPEADEQVADEGQVEADEQAEDEEEDEEQVETDEQEEDEEEDEVEADDQQEKADDEEDEQDEMEEEEVQEQWYSNEELLEPVEEELSSDEEIVLIPARVNDLGWLVPLTELEARVRAPVSREFNRRSSLRISDESALQVGRTVEDYATTNWFRQLFREFRATRSDWSAKQRGMFAFLDRLAECVGPANQVQVDEQEEKEEEDDEDTSNQGTDMDDN